MTSRNAESRRNRWCQAHKKSWGVQTHVELYLPVNAGGGHQPIYQKERRKIVKSLTERLQELKRYIETEEGIMKIYNDV